MNYLIDELPAVRDQLDAVVASSQATEATPEEADFEVTRSLEAGNLDLYIDGADEANKQFHLIKGGGGALTREKILAMQPASLSASSTTRNGSAYSAHLSRYPSRMSRWRAPMFDAQFRQEAAVSRTARRTS